MTETERKPAPKCEKCSDTGWREPIDGADGSWVTSRPCKACDAYENSPEYAAFRKAW